MSAIDMQILQKKIVNSRRHNREQATLKEWIIAERIVPKKNLSQLLVADQFGFKSVVR